MIPLDKMSDVKELGGMDPETLDRLGDIGEVIDVPAGTYLFHEGDRAQYYYILRQGKVALEFRQPDGSIYKEMVGSGMGVGISSLAGLTSYMSDARCEEASVFLRWPQSELRRLFNQYDRLGYLMMKGCAMSLNERIDVKN